MSLSLRWQYVVIAVLVAASAGFVMRRLAPQLTARWQHAAARALMRRACHRVLRWLGRRLMPKSEGGCGNSCGGCGASNEAASADPSPQQLQIHPRETRRRSA